MERRVSTTNRAKSGRAGVKRRDLEKKNPENKVNILCARLRSLGLYQYDEDWPNDEEDTHSKQPKVFFLDMLKVTSYNWYVYTLIPFFPWGGDLVVSFYEQRVHQGR